MSVSKGYTFKWSRFGYGAFIVLSAYFLFISKDLSSAVANLGIGLIFDPFDQKVSWAQRPFWQRIWLLVHVGLVLAGFGFLIFGK
jgi:hypothetical protein